MTTDSPSTLPGPGYHRANHYIPQGYLRQWAHDEARIWTYRTLVSHPGVREWRSHSIKGIANREHLYAQVSYGSISDLVERWLERHVDSPSAAALQRVAKEQRLSPSDWDCIFRFFACSQARTPAYFLRAQARWTRELPELMASSLKRTTRAIEEGTRLETPRGPPLGGTEVEPPIRVRLRPNKDGEGGVVEAIVLTGRRLWLTEIHRIASHSYKNLRGLHWTILRAPLGRQWLTSDDPAIGARISQDRVVTYDGGPGILGSYLFMPLSPLHMLYARVGARPQLKYTTMGDAEASFVQTCQVKHAHRLVFAQAIDDWVQSIRPRVIDKNAHEHERGEWEKLHKEHSQAERDLEDDNTWL